MEQTGSSDLLHSAPRQRHGNLGHILFIRVCGARATRVALHAGCLQNGNNSRWWPTVKGVCGAHARLCEDTGSDSKPFIRLHSSTTSHLCPHHMALPASCGSKCKQRCQQVKESVSGCSSTRKPLCYQSRVLPTPWIDSFLQAAAAAQ